MIRKTMCDSVSGSSLSNPNYTIDETLHCMLGWEVKWLEESHDTKSPDLPHYGNGPNDIECTKTAYKSFYEYFSIFQELLLREVWCHIVCDYQDKSRISNEDDSEENVDDDAVRKLEPVSLTIDSVTERKVRFPVNKTAQHNSFLVIKCHRFLEEDEFQSKSFEKASDFGVISLYPYCLSDDDFDVRKVFCYIESVDIKRTYPRRNHQIHFPRNDGSFHRYLEVTLLIQPIGSDLIIRENTEVELKVASYIQPCLRLFSSVISLPMSPLQSLILNPISHDYSTGSLPFEVKRTPSLNKLNSAQQEAVISCTRLCLNSKPNVALIEGPPGTGKSHVIVNLIEHVFRTSLWSQNHLKEKPKVLICSPTNLAVDNLAERLLDLREEMKKDTLIGKLSIVRVGHFNPKNRTVSSVSLEKLTDKRLNNNLSDDGAAASLQVNKRRYDKAQIRKVEMKILREADVICTTLSSSNIESMQTAFLTGDGNKQNFTCCIIDGASQCCEPDVLIPLRLNITKIILVGDNKQLAPIIRNDTARNKGLGSSLFFRIYSCWDNSDCLRYMIGTSPVHSLNIQYRMHPSILEWPANHFYNGQLQSVYNQKTHEYPIAPYMVIDHYYRETQKNEECNPKEADLVLDLSIRILSTIGCGNVKLVIITPYHVQRKCLLNKLSKRRVDSQVKGRIKAYTIDGYQGLEEDIVILSCVRSQGIGFLENSGRLNSAVTRAKHSLIICGNFDTFKNHHHWKSLLDFSKQRKTYIVFENIGTLQNIICKSPSSTAVSKTFNLVPIPKMSLDRIVLPSGTNPGTTCSRQINNVTVHPSRYNFPVSQKLDIRPKPYVNRTNECTITIPSTNRVHDRVRLPTPSNIYDSRARAPSAAENHFGINYTNTTRNASQSNDRVVTRSASNACQYNERDDESLDCKCCEFCQFIFGVLLFGVAVYYLIKLLRWIAYTLTGS